MTLNGVEIQSSEQLEQMIADMPEETKQFLRSLLQTDEPQTPVQ